MAQASSGVVTYSSNYVLVALSIDRYDAIAHPMKFHAGSWRMQCWIQLEPAHWQIYITLVFVALFFLPAFIIAGCYIVIVKTIWSKSKAVVTCKRRWYGKANVEQNRSLSSFAEDTDIRRASSRGIIPQAKIKTIKMTLIIVCDTGKTREINGALLLAVFISCWSPYVVFDLLQVYGLLPYSQTTIAVATFIQSLAPLNSAANPIIYCLCTTHICSNLRQIKFIDWLARKFCCCCPANGAGDDASFQRTTTQHTTTTDGRTGRGANAGAIPLTARRGTDVQQRINGAAGPKKHAVFVHDALYKSKSASAATDAAEKSSRRALLAATRSQPGDMDSEIVSEAV
ncbi:unnamed protein product [Notodromas monacha]|uniref:G-protein coupled receptors family 1 profile domain-containing protein n=1 Tax=Notodromas monacha TaxID=399045 RepID=A0A7R9BCZ3_9CRUS|nr:unnamed protein product [Notodromas monacha]CAG0913065.1 unnamed protein product [Notodromas monacha]